MTSETPRPPRISRTALRFKITLTGIRPPIWRRIEVPHTYTFWDLHSAIQDAMGWENYHLHEFRPGLYDPRHAYRDEGLSIGLPNQEPGRLVLLGWKVRRPEGISEPVCLGGKRACPPEDCGGIGGYYDLVDALAGKTDESQRFRDPEFYESYSDYDPAFFHPDTVVFMDPKARLEYWQGPGLP